MPAYDITALRLTAARNLGYTAGFLAATGHDFTGSITDYQQLSLDQQVALGKEMFTIVQEHPQDYAPAQVAVASGTPTADFTHVPTVLSPAQAAVSGAVEGLVNYPATVAKVGVDIVQQAGKVVAAAGQAAGQAVNSTVGTILGVKVSTLAWAGAAGIFLYFLANSPAGARAAAYTVERVAPRKNPVRRRKRRRSYAH